MAQGRRHPQKSRLARLRSNPQRAILRPVNKQSPTPDPLPPGVRDDRTKGFGHESRPIATSRLIYQLLGICDSRYPSRVKLLTAPILFVGLYRFADGAGRAGQRRQVDWGKQVFGIR